MEVTVAMIPAVVVSGKRMSLFRYAASSNQLWSVVMMMLPFISEMDEVKSLFVPFEVIFAVEIWIDSTTARRKGRRTEQSGC